MENNVLFKNLNTYRLGAKVDFDQLDSFLAETPFIPCLPTQEKTAGFPMILGLDRRVFAAGECLLFSLIVQEKLMPASAVKAEFQKVLQMKEADGTRLKKEEKKALKEQVREGMLPRAFIKNTEHWAYVDNAAQLLVVNTSSRKAADGLAMSLRSIVENGHVFPIRPQHDVGARMTFWVSEDQAPEPFDLGTRCVITDGDGSIRYTKRSLEDDNLREYLRADLSVSELALDFKDRCSLTLVDDFMVKDFNLSDIALADIDQGQGEPLEQLAGDILLMSAEVRDLLDHLFAVLGGEMIEVPIT